MPQLAAYGRDQRVGVQRFAGKVFGRKHGLGHQHLKAAGGGDVVPLSP